MATDEPVNTLAENWAAVSNIVSDQYQTHKLGKAVPESFSPKIQRRLASTVPPKPMVELSYEDAFKTLKQMCVDCQEAVRIVDFGPEHVQRLKVGLESVPLDAQTNESKRRSCGHSTQEHQNPSHTQEHVSLHRFSAATTQLSSSY
jgi:hypothetical protein